MYIPTYDDVIAAHERITPLHPPHAGADLELLERSDRGGVVLQMRELSEGRRVQGARRLAMRCLGLAEDKLARGVATHSSGNHALSPELCGRAAGHSLQRGDAAHRAAGQEGCGAGLWRGDHGMRALDQQPRGGVCRSGGQTGRGFRASLQRPARDRGAGHLFARVDGAGGGAGRGDRPDRRRRHDFGHLPDAVQHRAGGEDLRRRARAGRRRLSQFQGRAHHRRRRAR